jgi:replicative DNA helicase
MSKTRSFEVERQFLATLMNCPDNYSDIAQFISANDFCAENTQVNRAIFNTLKRALESGQTIDHIILTERLMSCGVSFQDNINVGDYISALSMRKTNPNALISLAKELRSYSVRRDMIKSAGKIINYMESEPIDTPFPDVVDHCDKMFHDNLNVYDNGESSPENLFDDMEEWVEDRGNNPIDEFGLKCPHPRLHELYGSLLRSGNITCITAGSGVGKTQFCLDFALKASLMNGGVPLLHFDNGEMSKQELQVRLCSALSGVPAHLIETGKWRSNPTIENKVRSVWPKVKNYKLYYFNVAGLSVDQMVNIIKRFYYAKVGRGNPMIFNFDYIKTTSEKMGNKNEWQVVGEMVDKFKQLVSQGIAFDGKPMISMITSVQTNRQGISNNRNADNVVEDDSIVSMSDRIIQFSSHLFFLRRKTRDEMSDSPDFGTHKLICLKSRWLGSNPIRATELVRDPNSTNTSNNCVFFKLENFEATEMGDLHDYYEHIGANADVALSSGNNELPEI